jgi:hypothetical protein
MKVQLLKNETEEAKIHDSSKLMNSKDKVLGTNHIDCSEPEDLFLTSIL